MTVRPPRAIEIARFVGAAMRLWGALAAPGVVLGFGFGVWNGCTPELGMALGFTAVAIGLALWGAHRVVLFCAIEPKASPSLLAFGVPMLAHAPVTLALILLVGDGYMVELQSRSCAYPWSVGGLFGAAGIWGVALTVMRRRMLPRPGATG